MAMLKQFSDNGLYHAPHLMARLKRAERSDHEQALFRPTKRHVQQSRANLCRARRTHERRWTIGHIVDGDNDDISLIPLRTMYRANANTIRHTARFTLEEGHQMICLITVGREYQHRIDASP